MTQDNADDWTMRMGPGVRHPGDDTLFRWFLIGKTAMLALTALVWFLGGEAFAVETVTAAPWPLAGVAFFGTAVAVGLPGMIAFVACLAIGFRRAISEA